MEALLLQLRQQLKQATQTNECAASAVRGILITTGLVVLVVSAVLTCGIIRSITVPLRHAVRGARSGAAGRLQEPVEALGRNMVAQLLLVLKDAQAALACVGTHVRNGVQNVWGGSTEVAQGNVDLNRSEAGARQHTSASMQERRDEVTHDAGNAQQASALARNATVVPERCSTVVGKVVETMRAINTSSQKIADTISSRVNRVAQGSVLVEKTGGSANASAEQHSGLPRLARPSPQMDHVTQKNAALVEQIAATASSLITQSQELVHAVALLPVGFSESVAHGAGVPP